MKILFKMFIICLFLAGCKNSISVDYKALMKENDYIFLDVRTKEEYEEAHVIGAINIPYDEIDENISLVREKIIFVYCKSGNRSSIAYKILNDLGFIVYDLGSFYQIDLPKE